MEDKIIEVFKKYSKLFDTEYNIYKCLVEEDWSNIASELVKLFYQHDISGQNKQLVCECKNEWIEHIDNFSDRMECKKCGKSF